MAMKIVKYCCSVVIGGFLLFCLPATAVVVSGDLNGDGVVDQQDGLALIERVKSGDLGGDIHLDGEADFEDVLQWQNQWQDYTLAGDANVVLHFRNSEVDSLHEALAGDLQVSSRFKPVTGLPMVNHAFITFATATMKAQGGPPVQIFSATAGDPARRIDLVELDDLGQILGGIDFPPGRVNWIRLYVLEGFPYTYIVGEDEGIYNLKVPSGMFRMISPGKKIVITPDMVNIVSVDMDVSRSIVQVSGTNSILKPVVKLYVDTDEVDDATGKFE